MPTYANILVQCTNDSPGKSPDDQGHRRGIRSHKSKATLLGRFVHQLARYRDTRNNQPGGFFMGIHGI